MAETEGDEVYECVFIGQMNLISTPVLKSVNGHLLIPVTSVAQPPLVVPLKWKGLNVNQMLKTRVCGSSTSLPLSPATPKYLSTHLE